jgi:2-polyprenyl-3-methyl-5-hydroxy-6-metoxy-1,4-benzoquinol methylase
MIDGEAQILERIAAQSDYGIGWERANTAFCFTIFQRYLKGPQVLEVGPADGVMTAQLMTTGHRIVAVEGAETFCRALKERHPGLTVVHSLVEDYAPDGTFDTIVLGHVLEHVADPVDILRRAKAWLAPQGRVLVAVPNANSLHRQAAVLMGILPTCDTLGTTDEKHGHRRVYYPQTLEADFHAAGLTIEAKGGYWLKPLAIGQMNDWEPAMVLAFMQLGEAHPDIAGVSYVVARAD